MPLPSETVPGLRGEGLIGLVKPGAKLPVGVSDLHAEIFEQFPIHTGLSFPADEVIVNKRVHVGASRRRIAP